VKNSGKRVKRESKKEDGSRVSKNSKPGTELNRHNEEGGREIEKRIGKEGYSTSGTALTRKKTIRRIFGRKESPNPSGGTNEESL